ncbi:hypothetical protein O9X81_00090 [Agrobacterium salinitolerans]|uniref:hypothetical protein n=1 Tax=Agrobacterium salinitolerans TaxID=1183413 RepID=UPI0022B81675|nr:hypothetical protein [Agrobacterium salinitolerans]MCZ7855007.1 hypothetical protein [Agrobacterium salinitolerans]
MKIKTEVIVIHETVLQSYLADSSTFLLFAALIGLGVYLDSSAMQWVGAIIGFLTMAGRISRLNRLTIDQARKRLDALEAGE